MRRWWTPAIVFAAALALRLVIVVELRDTALYRTPELDSIEYFSWAQQIASGDFSWPAAPSHGPGYPFFLALLLFVTRSTLGAQLVQAVMGATTCVLIALIARRVANDRAALIGGLFAAVYGPLALIDVSILAEGLFIFLLCATLLLLHTRANLFFAGTALGLAIITRPTAAILLPLFAWYLWRREPRTRVLLFVASTLYPVLPVMVHNVATTGDLLAIQSGSGMNFYIGNSPLHDGTAWARPGGGWDWLRGQAWRAGIRGAAGEDRYYYSYTFDEMHSAPGKWFMLALRKLVWLTQTEEIRDSHSFDFFLMRARVLGIAARMSVLLPFALFGIWLSRRSLPWIVTAYLMAMTSTVVFLVIGMRYRLPITPALFVFAGIGAASLNNHRTIVHFAIAFVVVFAFAHMWRHAPTHDIAEEWAMEGIALGKEHRAPDSLATFRHAIELDPYLGIAWTGRGDVFLPQRQWMEAQSSYTQSMNVDPHFARGFAHLALVRVAQGDRTTAISLLREAVAIRPEREAMDNLAQLLFREGDFDGSEQVLRDMLSIDPTDQDAAAALARVSGARRSRH